MRLVYRRKNHVKHLKKFQLLNCRRIKSPFDKLRASGCFLFVPTYSPRNKLLGALSFTRCSVIFHNNCCPSVCSSSQPKRIRRTNSRCNNTKSPSCCSNSILLFCFCSYHLPGISNVQTHNAELQFMHSLIRVAIQFSFMIPAQAELH